MISTAGELGSRFPRPRSVLEHPLPPLREILPPPLFPRPAGNTDVSVQCRWCGRHASAIYLRTHSLLAFFAQGNSNFEGKGGMRPMAGEFEFNYRECHLAFSKFMCQWHISSHAPHLFSFPFSSRLGVLIVRGGERGHSSDMREG